MSRLVYIVSLLFISNSSCGVKGPPEPPLPTEASLEKQFLKDTAKEIAPEPIEQKAPTVEKTKKPDPKKKSSAK
jgi:hypothetical protein